MNVSLLLFLFLTTTISLYPMPYRFVQNDPCERMCEVSYIYYPYWGDTGHAEIEVDGQCWTLKCCQSKMVSLEGRIDKRERGVDALPFYRYIITVTPEEFEQLKRNAGKKSCYSCLCSLEALNKLSQDGNFDVPFLFRLSPLISSCYLSWMKDFGSNRIKEIEFYGNEKTRESKIKTDKLMRLGKFRECIVITVVVATTLCILFIVYVAARSKH